MTTKFQLQILFEDETEWTPATEPVDEYQLNKLEKVMKRLEKALPHDEFRIIEIPTI